MKKVILVCAIGLSLIMLLGSCMNKPDRYIPLQSTAGSVSILGESLFIDTKTDEVFRVSLGYEGGLIIIKKAIPR